MRLCELLPNALASAVVVDDVLSMDWNENFDFSSVESIHQCTNELIAIQERFRNPDDIERMLSFSEAVVSDIIAAKSLLTETDEIIVLNYIQFIITTHPLSFHATTKDLRASCNWIAYSFCDDLSNNQGKWFDIERLVEYVSHPIVNELLKIDLCMVVQWIGDFYYVCRAFSAYPYEAKEILHWSMTITKYAAEQGCANEFTHAWNYMACWAANNDDDRISEMVELMEDVIADVSIPEEIRCEFVICLSTVVGNFSSKKNREWALLARNEYSHLLVGHQNLQVLLDGADWSDDTYLKMYFDEILDEVEKLTVENISRAGGRTVELFRITDRLIGLISPFIGHCIKQNMAEIAITLLMKWYETNSRISIEWDKFLFIYPNHIDSMRYLVGGEALIIERAQGENLESMMALSNKFLGLSTSVGRAPTFELHTPERFGVPDADISNDFELELVKFYDLNGLREYREENSSKLEGFISIPSHQHPVQYLTNKYLTEVWPYAVSMETPRADRAIQKVCLWCGAGSMTEAIEYDAAKSVFDKYGIEVDYFPSDKTNLEQFKELYQSDEYDLIWVMSHGEFDHWKPEAASISIGDGESIELDEILELSIPETDSRRLLFLNVCDGATHEGLGGLPKLGFAPALSNCHQCVVSHLWPVNPWAAALFGVLFAIKLSQTQNYFDAYSATLNNLLLDSDEIYALIDGEVNDNQQLLERLRRQGVDFNLMAHAGSAAFFQ